MKKIFSLSLAIIICAISIVNYFPVYANEGNNSINNKVIITREEKMLFSKLFFENNQEFEEILSAMTNQETSAHSLNEYMKLSNNEFNEEEINCIIKNIFIADEYVKEESNNHDYSIQPLWNKDTVHNSKTAELAKQYFSTTVANKIGTYNREVDIEYSATKGFVFNTPCKYIHFNEYASGSDDSRDYVASMWFVSSELAWKKGQKENAYMYLGYALHPLQDKEAHGQIDRGEKYPAHTYIVGSNRHHADDETGWEWTNSNRNELKKVPGSRVRYNATVSVTKTWLAKYSKIFT
ncbi:hypothetical protein [Eubacterium coprostanoligenes]|uniref:hypothetical protein n=1 Tax=Eubacterium coprostanoligenes TaxID=290054 RepID=UPI002354BBCF|nr:hypothetical protein [Eubacterium coprostanoligenes]MCI6254731.1 hypothetical protein [Eubacterium coprostanoligenes]MDD7357620.1 hypothetical protein [Eubacterium coprostanoligenes]MDY5399455.1 hypothetical protein [Eubacterium coprostanoligenes]